MVEEVTAYHEAGHAVMATVLGGKVQQLSVMAQEADEGLAARFGDAQIHWRRGRDDAKTFSGKLILVALAGPVAEMIYQGELLHPGFVGEWSQDWRMAFEAAEVHHRDERKRLAFLEQATREVYDRLREDRYWNAIAALADELAAHEMLEDWQVKEVLEFWLRREG